MPNPRYGIYLRNREKKHAVDADLRNRANEVDGDDSVDLISGLPEPILHHILCFLTQREAVQTAVLSKSWRNIGSTRPKFDFCERHFGRNQHKFISVMESTLHRYLNLNRKLPFHEFCLEMSEYNDLSIRFLSAWIPIVLDNMTIKSFHLSFFYKKMPYFDVPTNLLRTESLEELYLKKCNLNVNCVGDVKLKHLKSLKLIDVFIEDEILEFLLFCCPLIENLVISQCRGLKNIKLNDCFNLKHFRYCNWGRVVNPSIEIYIPSIESINIEGCPNWFHHHHSDNGNNIFSLLKSLHIVEVHLSSEFFDCLSCHIPALENLTFTHCYGFEEYQISSQTVKHLKIESMDMLGWLDCLSCGFPKLETLNIGYCYGLEECHISSRSIKHLKIVNPKHDSTMFMKASIDAPNLVEFEYEGRIPTSISFEKTSTEWESKLVLQSDVNFDYTDSLWCLELYEFLKGFAGSQISLDISVDHVGENRKHLKGFLPSLVAVRDTCKPIAVEHMTMQLMVYSSSSLSALISDMFCLFHPRNITQFTYRTPRAVKAFEENQLSEYLKKVLLSERAMRHCYSWKQYLEEVSMEMDPSLTSFSDDEIEPFLFRLKWKE